MKFAELVVLNLIVDGGALAHSFISEVLDNVTAAESQHILTVCQNFVHKNIKYSREDVINYLNASIEDEEFKESCLDKISVSFLPNWESFYDQLSDLKKHNKEVRLQETLVDTITNFVGGLIPIKEAIELLEQCINSFHLTTTEDTNSLATLKAARVEKLRSAKELGIDHFGTSIGFHSVDQMLGYCQEGNLLVLSGRPSSGKTRFLVSGSYNQSLLLNPEKEFIFVVEGEMIDEELVDKYASLQQGINPNKFRYPSKLDDSVIDSLGILRTSDESLFISQRLFTPKELLTVVRNLEFRLGKKCIFIWYDYLQLLSSKFEILAEYSKEFKGVAKALKLPIVLLSQLNSAAELKAIAAKNKLSADAKPTLANLSNAGSQIGADADAIFAVYRPSLYDPSIPDSYIQLLMIKGRFTENTDSNFIARGSQEIAELTLKEVQLLLANKL